MLHIHNGDSTAGALREIEFPGEHRAFREVLMEGPAPSGLSAEEWLRARSRFLSDAYELKPEVCEKDLREQEDWLCKASKHDEAILWFEHDLFCQINLIYLLEWFSKQSMGAAKLSLICVGEFPGVENFTGLGHLTAEQLASLFDKRHEVTPAEFSLAARAWAAYCASDPGEITRLLQEGTSAMPFLRSALRLHLMRFPSVKNGLGRVDNTALEMISNGPIGFKLLFPKFAKAQPAYGLGDSQFWCALKRLGRAREPLITIDAPTEHEPSRRSNWYHDSSFELTDTGRAVLAGERDFIETNGIDLWLGGVRLVNGAGWRWDEENGLLTRRSS